MSRFSHDDQLKFLLRCVKHVNNGKVDFGQVAEECGMSSRAAASKRYSRLVRNNGIHLDATPARAETKAKKRNAAEIARLAEEKRRKIEGDNADPAADDDEDVKPMIPKLEPGGDRTIKQEPNSGFSTSYYSSAFPHRQHAFHDGYGPSSASDFSQAAVGSQSASPGATLSPQQRPWVLPAEITSSSSSASSGPPAHDKIPSPLFDDILTSQTTNHVEIKAESQYHDITADVVNQNNKKPPSVQILPHDNIIHDFCNSDLFMPPFQQTYTPPTSPPVQSQVDASSDSIPAQTTIESSCMPPLGPAYQSKSKVVPAPMECIIIDD